MIWTVYDIEHPEYGAVVVEADDDAGAKNAALALDYFREASGVAELVVRDARLAYWRVDHDHGESTWVKAYTAGDAVEVLTEADGESPEERAPVDVHCLDRGDVWPDSDQTFSQRFGHLGRGILGTAPRAGNPKASDQ